MVWELLPEDAAYGGYYHGYYSGYYAAVCRRGSAPMTCVRLRPIRSPGGNDRRRGFLCVAVFAWAVLTDEPRLRNGWFVFRPAPLTVWRSWREWKSQPGEVQQFITLRVTRGYRAGGDLGTGSAVLEHPGPQRPSAQQRVSLSGLVGFLWNIRTLIQHFIISFDRVYHNLCIPQLLWSSLN